MLKLFTVVYSLMFKSSQPASEQVPFKQSRIEMIRSSKAVSSKFQEPPLLCECHVALGYLSPHLVFSNLSFTPCFIVINS